MGFLCPAPEVTFVTGLLETGRGEVYTHGNQQGATSYQGLRFPGLVVRHHNSFDVDGLQSVEKTFLPPLRPHQRHQHKQRPTTPFPHRDHSVMHHARTHSLLEAAGPLVSGDVGLSCWNDWRLPFLTANGMGWTRGRGEEGMMGKWSEKGKGQRLPHCTVCFS